MMKRETGFTLVEMAVTVAVIGIISAMLGPLFASYMSSKKQAYSEKQMLINQAIGQAFLDYAASQSSGTLPAPYTGLGYYSTIVDTASADYSNFFSAQLAKSGVSRAEINDDATGAQNVRVYQRVRPISLSLPAYYRSGPLITLEYDFGVIYLTACRKADPICNKSPVPGASAQLTAANFASWSPADADKAAYPVSTLPLQKRMLETTIARIDRLRDAFKNYVAATMSAGQQTTNPLPGSGRGGQIRANNQDCKDGWYDLSDPSSQVLSEVGLRAEEFGVTSWGGKVEYCRDYYTSTPEPQVQLYYGAFRIHKIVSRGIAPSTGNSDENVFFTF